GNLRIGARDERLVAAVVARKAIAVAAIVATTTAATLTSFAEALATVAPTAILVAAATLLVLALILAVPRLRGLAFGAWGVDIAVAGGRGLAAARRWRFSLGGGRRGG